MSAAGSFKSIAAITGLFGAAYLSSKCFYTGKQMILILKIQFLF
jgi:hypothetical protein